MQAATGVAPAPSATVFCPSISARMAEAISSSLTSDDLVHVLASAQGRRSRRRAVCTRDAVGNGGHARGSSVVGLPAWRDRYMEAAPAACTPMTLQDGFSLLDRKGDAADEAAAADGHHDLLHLRQLLQDLQADGALAGDDAAGR